MSTVVAAAPTGWLLQGAAFVRYRALRDLLAEPEGSPAVQSARASMLADPAVIRLLDGLADWPGTVISSHKSAGQPFHRLTFLADIGLRVGDPGVDRIVEAVALHVTPEGPFSLPVNVPAHFGGTGKDAWAWALCDAPLLVYGLAKLGLRDDVRVRTAIRFLAGLVRDNGWPCAVSEGLGSFRGPGRKDDPCPFATLAMLKALAQFDEWRDGAECRAGAETLLSLWEASLARHPYMFYMGTDFRKVKAPFVWYDLLHVLDVLSQIPSARGDPRMRDMVGQLSGKMDEEGRLAPESVWTWWKDWEFARRREPSRWITTMAWRVIYRVGGGTVAGSPSIT